jgi:hypothetical protein
LRQPLGQVHHFIIRVPQTWSKALGGSTYNQKYASVTR